MRLSLLHKLLCNNSSCNIANAFSTRSHWPSKGHVDEFKLNVSWLVNISKIVDQQVNIAVALSRLRAGKFGGKMVPALDLKFVFANLTV